MWILDERGAKLAVVLCALGCGGARARSVGADTWRVECTSSMTGCASRAEEVCSDRGFVVLSGRSLRGVYGPEGQQVATERAELVVQCGNKARDGGAPQQRSWTLERPVAPPPEVSPQVCVPGSTQRCFGPGACQGGQTCAADGAGFEACNCGGPPAVPQSSLGSESSPTPAVPQSPLGSESPPTPVAPQSSPQSESSPEPGAP